MLLKIVYFFFCIKMGYSQVPTSTPAQTKPENPAATEALTSLIDTIKTNPGKYTEFQSICRENEFDQVADLNIEIQKKRIEYLKNKINKTSNVSFKIRLLKEYVDQKKKSEVEELYFKLKEEKLNEESSQLADAIFFLSKSELKKSETLLAKIVLDNPKNKEALNYLADVYKLNRNYFEAAAAYFDLAKLTNENFDLAFCEIQTLDSQHKEADQSCKKAIQSHPKSPFPFIYLGISKRESLNYDEALSYFKDSLLKAKSEMGLTCLAEIYFIKEKYSLAVQFFSEALIINAKSSRALMGLAWAQFKDKKYDDSLSSFKQACLKDKRVKVEIRRAFKILVEEKSPLSKKYAELAQNCND